MEASHTSEGDKILTCSVKGDHHLWPEGIKFDCITHIPRDASFMEKEWNRSYPISQHTATWEETALQPRLSGASIHLLQKSAGTGRFKLPQSLSKTQSPEDICIGIAKGHNPASSTAVFHTLSGKIVSVLCACAAVTELHDNYLTVIKSSSLSKSHVRTRTEVLQN